MSPNRHLDDEQLSALLDGVADPDDVAHAESCPECAARIEAWRAAVRFVAVPPADPPLLTREAAVHAALGAASASAASAGNGSGGNGSGTPTHTGKSWRRSIAKHGRGLGAAAATLAIVAGLSALVAVGPHGTSSKSSSSGTSSHATVAGPAAGTSSSGAGSAGASSASGSQAAPVFGPALGAYTSPSALASALRTAVNANSVTTPPAPTATSAGGGASSHSEVSTCEAEAAHAAAAPGAPIYQAGLTYQGAPAEAYVFVVNGHDVAVVERTTGCVMLARLTL